MTANPNKESYEQVSIFDKPALFTSLRLDRDKLPEGVYKYEIRHSDEDGMEAVQAKDFVLVNHMGTIITKEPIQTDEDGSREINDEDDFYFTGQSNLTLSQFINNESPAKEQIAVVVVEPLRQPYQTKMNNGLVPLQQKVGGYIEIVRPFGGDNACLICNEEGKIRGLPLNREINADIIAGTFIIAGLDEDGEIASLSDGQVDMYKGKFHDIELFGVSFADNKSNKDKIERE